MTFDNENNLDALKDFGGSKSNVNRRIAPLCLGYLTSVSYMLNGLHFKWPVFRVNLLGLGPPLFAVFRWWMKICIECSPLKFLWLVGPIWSSSLTLDISSLYIYTQMYAYIHTYIQWYTSTKIGQNSDIAGWNMFNFRWVLRFFCVCPVVRWRNVLFSVVKFKNVLCPPIQPFTATLPFVCWSVIGSVLGDTAFVFRVDLEAENLIWIHNTHACQVPVSVNNLS